MDGHTIFQIASNSKAFTTAALAILVDEGKLAWDDPVTKHLPWFQLSDPYVTRELTVRVLLVHRSGLGLGAGDLLWYHSDYPRDSILRRGRLVLRFSRSPALTGDLGHWQYDTFVARWRQRNIPDAYVTFALEPDGSIETMKMAAVSPLADFSYDFQDLLFRPANARR